MLSFGLITEGVTDQKVLQAILTGFFEPDEIDTRPFLPIADNTYRHQVQSFSNWELVLKYCASPQFEQAFPFVDYVVVQIDTDRCDEANFGVRKETDGKSLSVEEIVERVAEKLMQQIGPVIWEMYRDRIIFAIAVETTECWLLPLYALENKDRRLNCTHALQHCLDKKNMKRPRLQSKNPQHYQMLADPYARRQELMKRYSENPSLAIFIERLITLSEGLPHLTAKI